MVELELLRQTLEGFLKLQLPSHRTSGLVPETWNHFPESLLVL